MRRCILVANEDRKTSGFYGDYLSRAGYRVETVNDAIACINRLRHCSPDLLLLDRQLPWGGGNGVLACLREETALARIPVILFADVVPVQELALLVVSPVVRCLEKQCAVTTLRYCIDAALAESVRTERREAAKGSGSPGSYSARSRCQRFPLGRPKNRESVSPCSLSVRIKPSEPLAKGPLRQSGL